MITGQKEFNPQSFHFKDSSISLRAIARIQRLCINTWRSTPQKSLSYRSTCSSKRVSTRLPTPVLINIYTFWLMKILWIQMTC